MKLCAFSLADGMTPRLGLERDGGVLDVTALVDAGHPGPGTMAAALADWDRHLRLLTDLAKADGQVHAIGAVRFLPPVDRPPTFRDFYAFEQHVKTARAGRGLEMIPAWYEIPVFYFSNPLVMHGHEQPVATPPGCQALDFELEIGAVIGRGGTDLDANQAEQHIAGFCVLNDWSARDLQRQEMAVGLGPAKGKDFATACGPWLVTPDELADRKTDKGYNLTMTARRNGNTISNGNWQDIHYSVGEMIARAAAGVRLHPGELIGSGTVGTGCILELTPEKAGGWLATGDRIELEIERLGTLANTVTR